ncbi:MAG: RRNA methylase family protein, partial [uncultured Nocardioidaceae bacterium]
GPAHPDRRPRRPSARGLPRPPRRRAAQAPRVERRALHRRGREGRAAGRRGRLRTPLVPDGTPLARGAGGRPREQRRPLLRRGRGDGRGGHRVPRPPRCARIAAPDASADRGAGAGRSQDGRRPRGRRRPHERRSDLPQRRRARRRRDPAVAALRGPPLPPLDQGRHGRGVHGSLRPGRQLVRRGRGTVRRRVHDGRPHPGRRLGRHRGRGGRPGPDRAPHGHRGPRAVGALVERGGGARGHPDGRRHRLAQRRGRHGGGLLRRSPPL